MLGDRLLTIAIIIFAITWIVGWFILIVITILQKVLPRKEESLEQILQKIAKYLEPTQKYSLLFATALFAIYLLAKWLGWVKN